MAVNQPKNQYGVVIGSDEDVRIREQCKEYAKVLKWGNVKLDDIFKDQKSFDVQKMEDCYKAVHAFVEMKVLIQSDALYQTVKRDEVIGKITGELMSISRVRPRITKEEALVKTLPYENLMSEDWYRMVINEKVRDGTVVPYLGVAQYSSEGTIPCVSVRAASSFMTQVQQRTRGRDAALVLRVPTLRRSATGGYIVNAVVKGKGKGKVKGVAKAKAKVKGDGKGK